MARRQHRYVGFMALGLAMLSPAAANAQDPDDLAPYKMLRSLQFVQDSVVTGDHSAGEMQRFMLGTIDTRLRTVEPSIFDDDRNVDAALIYTMSGGNPQTLEYLIAHDVNGYFDNRVTDVLRKYLSGKGLLVAKTLQETAREYRDKKIGPYLALIGGNVLIATKPTDALDLYDQARLAAPGTIVEEAALRRSLAICVDKGMLDRGMAYSQRYVRRFLHSPYASQFADLFVTLVVGHDHDVKPQDVIDILSFMDAPRQREVYLRIARAAAISGKPELARMAVGRVQSLGGTDNAFGPLADFYGGMAGLPTEDIDQAAKNVSGIDGNALSRRDQALQEAARSVAEQILRAPDPASLTQASNPNTDHQEITSEKAAAIATQPGAPGALPEPVPGGVASTGQSQDTDPSFNAFVTTNRSKLDEIDGLLAQEGNEQ
ncbi:chemotaxis protein [Rhizobium leguminosarum bv. viciae 248]|uniref:chemotaxis protein MotC n=1 Tax=Rhizobium TaxID=379 RepID=UPI00037DB677|nr:MULTISPECIES: chemotaxis protein MotC [Rhizobium]MBY3138164.1 chemotaxis protein [Rhizobium laguerreae]MBY5589195.1 chemotaxis protein [Rhizobium leguminosarum]MBY5717767.1 chemotaxis protein [Rhizobium leguminosarum]MCA2411058.1 chemotaxis protein [Rhizobium leguminosarum]NKM64303.1 chemotaxis protein [Rhizobium leguminosarum bv. viciae]